MSRDVKFVESDPHVTNNEQQDTSVKKFLEMELDVDANSNDDKNDVIEPARDEGNDAIVKEILRGPERVNRSKPPLRLIETINKITAENNDPKSYEVLNSQNAQHWMNAMNEEIESFSANKTCTLVELPERKTAVGCKWVYKMKTDEEGKIIRHKSRLVAQGFAQKFVSDYDKVFAPVVRPTILRLLLTVAGHEKLIVKHYDIQSACLNGELSHEAYMKQPKGYVTTNDQLVYKLNKNAYELKQGASEWNKKLNTILTGAGYVRSLNDPCLYVKQKVGYY